MFIAAVTLVPVTSISYAYGTCGLVFSFITFLVNVLK